MTRLFLFHPMDVRGRKLGGIETHVRLVLAHHPASMSVLVVGVDEIGDCELGRVRRVAFEDREVDFLPVMRANAEVLNAAARRLTRSTTLRFLLAALRHLPDLRRAIGGADASCEIERFEFALLPKLLRLPTVLIVHNEGTREDKMDSLLKRYWFIHLANERLALTLADRVFAVNAAIAERVAAFGARLAGKTEVLSVSVDTRRFRPIPFDMSGATFRVCFAGRLDAFKDPPLMFATLARLAERLAASPVGGFRHLAFDYVGASDPALVPEFGAIAALTTLHGTRAAPEVAAIMGGAHAGLITSFFEGMPCYLLETLASGRPVVAVALPQFASLIKAGRSGRLVARSEDRAATAAALAEAMHAVAAEIASGRLDPMLIAASIEPFSVERQMGRLFACHEALAASARSQPSESAKVA